MTESVLTENSPEILQITNPDHVTKAAILASKGCPICFCGNGIYGLGGLPAAFIKEYSDAQITVPCISTLKKRDFLVKPPVILASLEKMNAMVDWNQLVDKFKEFHYDALVVKQLIFSFYNKLAVHLVLPIKNEIIKSGLVLGKTNEDNCRAFMCTGMSETMQAFIKEFERQTEKPFLVTSANPSGEESFTKVDQVQKAFPQIPLILADNRPEVVSLADRICSFSVYDFSKLPERIGIQRLGSVAHGKVIDIIWESGIRPAEFDFSNLDFGSILTIKPHL